MFNAWDVLPDESVELTIQHLNMLACCDMLSEKAKGVCSNASVYLTKLVVEPESKPKLRPIPSTHGKYFGSCPLCNKSIRSIDHPHFCGYCGCRVEWEG